MWITTHRVPHYLSNCCGSQHSIHSPTISNFLVERKHGENNWLSIIPFRSPEQIRCVTGEMLNCTAIADRSTHTVIGGGHRIIGLVNVHSLLNLNFIPYIFFILYLHVISACYIFMLYMHVISSCYICMLYLHVIYGCYIFMLYMHIISSCYIYMLYLHVIYACYIFMLYMDVISSCYICILYLHRVSVIFRTVVAVQRSDETPSYRICLPHITIQSMGPHHP